MPPKNSVTPKLVTGPSRDLISRIERLQDLLKNLPESLPNNPPDSSYRFYLDTERLELGGFFGAAGHALEISFRTFALRDQPLRFLQRGSSLDDLPKLLKIAVKNMNDGERENFRTSWIERLITAAIDSGAKIPTSVKRKAAVLADDSVGPHPTVPPAKKPKVPVIVVDDSDSDSFPAHPSHSAPVATSSTSHPSRPSASAPPKNVKQTTFAAFGWKPATAAEIQQQWNKVADENSEKRKAKAVADQLSQEEKKQRDRDLATLRKRRQREREKATAAESDDSPATSVNAVLMTGAKAAALVPSIADVADVSRPATQAWKKSRNGTKGGVIQDVPSKRVFWFHPFLFNLIEAAIRRRDWSLPHAVADLRRSHPHLFDAENSRLHKGTVWKWIVPNERRFTEATLQKISTRRSLVGTGRVGILAPHPEIFTSIVETLQGLRASGCVVNAPIARAFMIAIITEARPELLTKFKCSEKFVRAFLESELDWTMRKATRAAKHIPDDAGILCKRAFFRLAYVIEHEKIPAKVRVVSQNAWVIFH